MSLCLFARFYLHTCHQHFPFSATYSIPFLCSFPFTASCHYLHLWHFHTLTFPCSFIISPACPPYHRPSPALLPHCTLPLTLILCLYAYTPVPTHYCPHHSHTFCTYLSIAVCNMALGETCLLPPSISLSHSPLPNLSYQPTSPHYVRQTRISRDKDSFSCSARAHCWAWLSSWLTAAGNAAAHFPSFPSHWHFLRQDGMDRADRHRHGRGRWWHGRGGWWWDRDMCFTQQRGSHPHLPPPTLPFPFLQQNNAVLVLLAWAFLFLLLLFNKHSICMALFGLFGRET